MPERKPSPEAEFIADVQATALEATTQLLGGVAAFKQAGDRLRKKYEKRVFGEGGAGGHGSSLGDLLFSSARLHVEHVRTALKFQRWLSDELVSRVQQGAKCTAPDGEKPVHLEGRKGEVVALTVQTTNLLPETWSVSGHTRVTPKSGVAFYVEWKGTEPSRVSAKAAVEICVSLFIDPKKFKAGDYEGETVFEFGSERRASAFRLTVRD